MVKRRSNGDGTIFQRKDGRWVGQLLHEGEWIRQYGKTRAEVRNWLLQKRREIAGGLDVHDQSTMDEFLKDWLETAAASVWTVRKIHVCLHRALGQAYRWGLTARNVADLVDKPRAPGGSGGDPLTLAEVQRFLTAAQGEPLEGLFYLAVVTGMRQGELRGLCWSDVDWETGRLSVCRQVQRVQRRGGGLVFAPVKWRAGVRVVALGEDALVALRRQLERVRMMRRVAGERWLEHDLVFPSSVGTPLEGRRVWGEFLKVLEKAGVRRRRFHDLRHTAATLALRQRVPAKVVQERLGHSRVEVTLNVYSHVIEDMQAEAAASIEAAVRSVVMELPAVG